MNYNITSVYRFVVTMVIVLGVGCSFAEQNSAGANDDSSVDSVLPADFDVDALWQDTTPISDSMLKIWSSAIERLGTDENRSCTYTKLTEPCDDCGDELVRRSFYALRHSLLQPGFKALMEWFDTPVAEAISYKIEEQFDSSLEPPWTLVSLDEVKPDEAQEYSHYQEKIALHSSVEQKRARRESRIPVGDFHPAAMKSWFESLAPTHYLGTQDGQIFLGLQPNRRTKSPLTKHVQLTLAIDDSSGELSIFDQRSVRSFAPHFGLRVRHLRYQGVLGRDPTLDVVVLKRFDYQFKVRLTGIFPSENRFTYEFQDFECAEKLASEDVSPVDS